MDLGPHILPLKALLFDVDGVMTNGITQVTEEGQGLRSYNIKDGFALQYAVKQGYKLAILSGGTGASITHRFAGLGITEIYTGQESKLGTFQALAKKWDLKPQEMAYMGDDIPDIPVLKACGLAACPADAADEVLQVCSWISSRAGGMGCVREFLELVLKTQNKWNGNGAHIW